MEISGVEFEYYFVCKTQLWLFAHQMVIANEDETVKSGKKIHEHGYKKEKTNQTLARSKFDVVKIGKTYVVYERKRQKFIKGSFYQLKYYLYQLYKKGIKANGILIVPGKRILVKLTKQDTLFIEKTLKKIEEIIKSKNCPPPKKCKYCRKCAYKEFCFSGDDE